MDAIISFISSYISYWPLTVFFALLLAGLNLPISEDAMIILSSTFAKLDKSLLIPNYIALYAGIVTSDIMSYFLGKYISKGALKFKSLGKKLTPDKLKWIANNLEKHGFLTFIVCRFIPFGVRNMLFMGSGFLRLPFKRFVIYDTIAALISSSTLYFLVYFIGQNVQKGLKILGIILFIALVISIPVIIIRNKKKKSASKPQA